MNHMQFSRRRFLQLTTATTTGAFLGLYPPITSPQGGSALGAPLISHCTPSDFQINAMRLRTRDGRYLRAVDGGDSVMVATKVTPGPFETFLFVWLSLPGSYLFPGKWPLSSGDPITLTVCTVNFDYSNQFVRVERTITAYPSGDSWTYGGADSVVRLYNNCLYHTPSGCPRAEWMFWIEKADGSLITTNDEISLRTENGFYFRTTSTQDGAGIVADGTTPFQEDTVFVVEFSQVKPNVGWLAWGDVTGTVIDAATGRAIDNAVVFAIDESNMVTTGVDGRFTFSCLPVGTVAINAFADMYVGPGKEVTVTAEGSIDVRIELNCNKVSGVVFDSTGQRVKNVTVHLYQPTPNDGRPVRRPDGSIIAPSRTNEEGKFFFTCVPAGLKGMWTEGIETMSIEVPPSGLQDIAIRLPPNCGLVSGIVTDAVTGQPIKGAKVKVGGSSPGAGETITNDQGEFTIDNVCDEKQLITRKPGYQDAITDVNVPATGLMNVNIKLTPDVIKENITIVLTWGSEPRDLDSHLSGPDGQGGRFHITWIHAPGQNPGVPPVNFVSLNIDDRDAGGPETLIISKSPDTGAFVAGEYRYWVHNFSGSPNFTESNAVVTVFRDGVQFERFTPASASSNPSDFIWHVVNLQIDTNGMVLLTTIQRFQSGDTRTEL